MTGLMVCSCYLSLLYFIPNPTTTIVEYGGLDPAGSSLAVIDCGNRITDLCLYIVTEKGEFGELMNNGGAITTWRWLKALGCSLPLTALAVAAYPGNFGVDAAWIRVYTQETGK